MPPRLERPSKAEARADERWDGVERRVATRRTRRVYRFIDRRHGFDRRKPHPVLGTMRDRPWLLVVVLVGLNLLSVLDGVFTMVELRLGIAAEGNPILDAAVRQHPLLAVGIKVGSMALVTLGIWHGRSRRSILLLSLARSRCSAPWSRCTGAGCGGWGTCRPRSAGRAWLPRPMAFPPRPEPLHWRIRIPPASD